MGSKVIERIKGSDQWWVRTNHHGTRGSVFVGPKLLAEKLAEKIRAQCVLGQWPAERMVRTPDVGGLNFAPAPVTIKSYYEKTFLPFYIRNGGAIASSTAASYQKNFSTHILPALGDVPLAAVDYAVLETFISTLTQKTRRVREATPKPLAKATIQTVIKMLRRMFSHAILRKLTTVNPVTGLGQLTANCPVVHEVIEPLTRDEVPVFLAAVRAHAPEDFGILFTAIHAGLRAGELAGLQVTDINWEDKRVKIQRSIDRVARKTVTTKTKHVREVDLSDPLIIILREHIRAQREVWFKKGKPLPVWLFPNERGGWTDMGNLSDRVFKMCLDKAGLRSRRFHDLRHSFASLHLTAGAPIVWVSEQLGHASIKMTVDIYGHLTKGANRHWANALPNETPIRIKEESHG